MSDSRLAKLSALLESRNRSIRAEAITTLVQLTINQPSQLLSILKQYSQSSVWDGRVAAAELLGNFLQNMDEKFQKQLATFSAFKANQQNQQEFSTDIKNLVLKELLDRYQMLVSDEDDSERSKFAAPNLTKYQKRQQRVLFDQHLEMNSATGVTSQAFITDDELANSKNSNNNASNNSSVSGFNNGKNKELLRAIDCAFLDKLLNSDQSLFLANLKDEEAETEVNYEEFFNFRRLFIKEFLCLALLRDLTHQKWHIRHGAALMLAKICLHSDKWLFPSPELLSIVAISLLKLLTLDRFCDFVTGSNAVAPVREASAQALAALLLKQEKEATATTGKATVEMARVILADILGQLGQLLNMEMEQHWQCRQTAFLALKYHFSASKFIFPDEQQLFQKALHTLETDPMDEVVSAASQALCSLFDNTKLDTAMKAQLLEKVIAHLWPLLECPLRLAQLREGVDSMLVDFLSLLALWLHGERANSSCALNNTRVRLIIELLDCSGQCFPVTRVRKALECIRAILKQPDSPKNALTFTFSEENLLFLLKRLYRCILFCPPSECASLIAECQSVLESLLQFCRSQPTEMDALLHNGLALNIGLWISCLVYDHKKPEIDVFLHNVDGTSSRRDSPRELLCGEELRFLNPSQIDETILERKTLAAHWLGPLLDALFRLAPGHAVGQQPMGISIQLLFLPYFRSNSLYQKLGAALMTNAWAMHQWKNSEMKQEKLETFGDENDNGQQQQTILLNPDILTNKLVQQFFSNSKKSTLNNNRLFDEVATMVNNLTRECNEFQQYCVRKGVPRQELMPLNQANSMEEVVLSTYQNCERRLKRADERQALLARHAFLLELVQSTKQTIRNYTNRIDALAASTIFHFANSVPLPLQLTPLIKPLMEELNTENNQLLADLIFSKTFPILFKLTSQRQPCPHAKLLKQLALGLENCENFAPKIVKWSDAHYQHRLLTMDHLEPSASTSTATAVGTPSTSTATLQPLMATKMRNCRLVLRAIVGKFGDKLAEVCPELLAGDCSSLDGLDLEVESMDLEQILLRMNFLGTIFPTLPDSIRKLLIAERIGPRIQPMMDLLGHFNPAVRFRLASFIAELTTLELCQMLRLIYGPLKAMMIPGANSNEFARLGAVELLVRLASIGEQKLLGVVSLLAPLVLRAIGDQREEIRTGAAHAFRQLVLLLPIESRQKHFIHELAQSADGNDGGNELAMDYTNSFALIDVLSSPGNLPRLRQAEIHWLRGDVSLRDYQLEGITWLSFLHRFGLNGILADDMGLGKTLQVLSLLAWDHSKRHNLPPSSTSSMTSRSMESSSSAREFSSLIVCPRTLLDHWCKEWNSYFPMARTRIEAIKLADWKRYLDSEQRQTGNSAESLLVVSYEELRANRKLSEHHWHYVVLDEGHCIRNPGSQIFDACCSLKSSHRLILSGTPVQNSPADLWALFSFLMPGYLSTRSHFQAKFMRQIMACRNPKASEQQIKEGEQALQLLHKQCLPFVMRRLKSEVLSELPEKIVQDRLCELTLLQREIYEKLVSRCSVAREQPKREETEKEGKDDGNNKNYWISPLQTLHALRKLVDHPCLIADLLAKMGLKTQLHLADWNQMRPEHSGKMLALQELLAECQIGEGRPTEQARMAQMPATSNNGKQHQMDVSKKMRPLEVTNAPSASPNLSSSPLDEVKQPFESLLPSAQCSTSNTDLLSSGSGTDLGSSPPQHRALIFCQWRATVELVTHFLNNGSFGAGIRHLRLDGCIPATERQSIVDRFNSDPSIDLLLLTTHIGGVGLNLTGADVVIFVDHDWNPFRDLQAIDRAHRLGQRRTVNVYRLITEGTVEEKVMRLQRFKADTANALVGADNRSLASMATDELLELFSLDSTGGGTSAGSASKAGEKKRRRLDNGQSGTESGGEWKMDKLWGTAQGEEGGGELLPDDELLEQYSEQHSLQAFLQQSI